jgi:hypothetical protein
VTRGDSIGFAIRFTLVLAVSVGVPAVIGLTEPGGVLRYVVAGGAAATFAVAYLARWRAEALLAFAVFMLFHATLARWIDAPLAAVDELSVGMLAVVALPGAMRAWRGWIAIPREAALGLVVAIGVVSSIAAGVPATTWMPALVLLMKAIVFLYIVMWTEFREWELRGGMFVVLVIGVAVLALGLIEIVVSPVAFQQALGLHEYDRTRSGLPVAKSLFFHPVLFAWFTVFVAIYLFSAHLVTRRWRWLLLGLAFTAGPFIAVRRRAILALAGALVAGLLRSLRWVGTPRDWARVWGPIGLGFVLVVALFLPALGGLYDLTVERYLPPPASTPTGGQPSPDTPDGGDPQDQDEGGLGENPQARVALYIGSIQVARDHAPIGAGLGRFASWMSRVDYSPLYREYGLSRIHGLRPTNPRYVTDTFWPQILGELGIAGLAAYVAFLAAIGTALWREAARADGPLLTLFRLGAGMVFVQALVESLASAMFHSPPRIYLTYLVVGAVLSLAWRRHRTDP